MKEASVRKSRISKIIVGGVIVVLLAVIAYLVLKPADKPKTDSNILTNSMSVEGIASMTNDMQAEADRNKIGVKMPSTFTFKSGNPEGSLNITSKKENNYSFAVTVIIDGETEPIIETGLVPPGTTLPSGKLLRNLNTGDYPASAYLINYDDKGEKVSQVGVAVTINVSA